MKNKLIDKIKSVKSKNPYSSLIQTIYDIVKAHGGDLKVENMSTEQPGNEGVGAIFIISLPL